MGWAYLGVSLFGALFVLNAFGPRKHRFLMVPSFFASWLTIELAGHHIAWQAVASAAFIRFGALDTTAGWVALGITILQWIGLVVLILEGRRSVTILRDALEEIAPEEDEDAPRIPRSYIALPFRFKRPGTRRVRNVVYGHASGRDLKLDVYLPDKEGRGRPVVMQIHGGGWVIGDKKEQGLPLLGHLAANGWVGFNVNYRLSPVAAFPDHLIDLKRALVWIKEHAHEYGGDPDFVAVTGGSAGGHLTAMMALTANDPRYQPGFEDADTTVQAAVPFYGIYDFTNRLETHPKEFVDWFIGPVVLQASFEREPERFAEASPIDRVRADAPPFLVIHGDRDVLAPLEDCQLFVEHLREVSTSPVLYAEMRGAQHAFDIFMTFRTAPVIEGVERFLHTIHQGRLEELDEEVEEPEPEVENTTVVAG